MKLPWSRTSRTAPTSTAGRRAARRSRPAVELMEGRQLLSTFTFQVTNVSDNGDNSSPLAGSLRAAVVQANRVTGNGNTAEIDFRIAGGGYQTLSVSAPLPSLSVPTFINAASQPGYAGAPLVQLDGTYAGPGAVGLTFTGSASGSRVTGLEVGMFNGGGVLLNGASHVTIDHDWIGPYTLTRSGAPLYITAHGNGTFGVELAGGSSHNTLDTDTVSANVYNGVVITGASSSNTISNSKIGTDASGLYAVTQTGSSLGNGQLGGGGSGVVINTGSTGNTLFKDVISNNHDYGVFITDPGTTGNALYLDDIGTDANGATAFPNHFGVTVANGAQSNNIGVTGYGPNVVSGNAWDGVQLLGSGTSFNRVTLDRVGTNAAGTAALANGGSGVAIAQGASSNNFDHALVSGNVHYGFYVSDPGTAYNFARSNDIGTDVTASRSVPNNWGVWVQNGATFDTFDGNVISGNSWTGIELTGPGTSYDTVSNNLIGTNSTGNIALPNAGAGLALSNGTYNNSVYSNVVSGNSLAGIWLNAASGNVFSSNKVGLGADGAHAVANPYGFELLNGSTGNLIGGTAASRNFISGNTQAGVLVSDPGTSGNTLQYDFIGTDVTGEKPVSNGNGVMIQNGASYTYVYNDVISANLFAGVNVTGGNTNNNFITSDWIGLDATGTRAVKQLGQAYSNATGVVINSAYNTSVGNNFISGNITGVNLNSGATSNWIVYDHIGTGADGLTNVGNLQDGVILDGVSNNVVSYDTLVYNGDVGILGENGSTPDNNSLVGDVYSVTVNGVTYTNRLGQTDFD